VSAQPVSVTLDLDASRFVAAMERATRAAARAFDRHRIQTTLAVDAFRDLERAEHLVDVVRAGAWGRWYVRGAMDPTYSNPGQRDLAAQELASRGQADLAGALLAGWVSRSGDTPCGPLAWHRLLGRTRVEVSRG
jgi:hypothetical protein